MTHDKNAVRKILDQAKAAKREALTAPEARGVCEAYGITIPKEGVAKSAEEAAKLASDIGFPVVMKIVSPQILHKTEAGGVIVGVKSARGGEGGLRDHRRQCQEIRCQGRDSRRASAADADRRPGGHHRCGDRPGIRQAGGLRPGRHPGRGAEGHHLPSGARHSRGGAVDAGRHRRGGDPARCARRQARGPRGARRDDRDKCRRWSRTFPKYRRWT